MWQEELKRDLEQDEGRRKWAYRCPANKLTVGIGHNIEDRGVPVEILLKLAATTEWSDECIDAMYEVDAALAIRDAKQILGEVYFNMLPDTKKRVLVNMSFNMGYGKLLGFKRFLQALRDQDWPLARKELLDSKAARSLPNRYARLADLIHKDA